MNYKLANKEEKIEILFVLSFLLKEHDKLDTEDQRQLFSLIDIQKVNEKTLEECKNSQFVPANVVTEAALSLCSKLRKELDEVKLLNKPFEISPKRPLGVLGSIDVSCPHATAYSTYTAKHANRTYRSPCKYE